MSGPGVGLGALAWVALIPACWVALSRTRTRAGRAAIPLAYGVALELTFIQALPFGIAEGQFGETPLPVMVGDSPVLVVCLVLVPAFAALLYLLRFGSPAGEGWVGAVLWPALCLMALDLLRTKLDPGGLWGTLHLSQHDTPAAHLAELGGPWLVGFAIAAVGYSVAFALVNQTRRAIAAAGALGAAAAALALAFSADPDPGRNVRILAVQPGYDTAREDLAVLRHFQRGTYHLSALDLTEDLGQRALGFVPPSPDLVVFPEAALWADPERYAPLRRWLASLARNLGAPVVATFFQRGPDVGDARIVDPAGDLSAPAPKQRPMWFLGEEGTNKRSAKPLRAAGIEVGTLLGVDNQDPAIARRLTREGAELLISATHDWKQLARHQRAASQLHATAVARPLVRADWRYGSAAYGAGGEAVEEVPLGLRPLVLDATVATSRSDTPYAVTGDGPWVVLALLVPAGWLVRRVRPSLT